MESKHGLDVRHYRFAWRRRRCGYDPSRGQREQLRQRFETKLAAIQRQEADILAPIHQALPGRSWPVGRAIVTTKPELYADPPHPDLSDRPVSPKRGWIDGMEDRGQDPRCQSMWSAGEVCSNHASGILARSA
jgi:hypothetical protein